ncbi:MAG: hypothetical protein SV253_01905 [Halobacteria archaeon]|nr:hypothetical protein [Halobacteria archaeon]
MSDSHRYERGDVFWAPDPFRDGSNPRLWLLLASDTLPYPNEEYICAALTTTDLPHNFEIGTDWTEGKNPDKTSYCSPWVIATIKHSSIVNPQGRVTQEFTDKTISETISYLSEENAEMEI